MKKIIDKKNLDLDKIVDYIIKRFPNHIGCENLGNKIQLNFRNNDNEAEIDLLLPNLGIEIKKEEKASAYKLKRAKEYTKEGLSFDSFVELLIENDDAAMAQFRAKRDVIKVKHPKPVEI